MTKARPLQFLSDLTTDDLAIARAFHAAGPETQALMRFLVHAQALAEEETALVAVYRRLTPERRALVDDLVRELDMTASETGPEASS